MSKKILTERYRILLIHYSCPPMVGGVEEVVRQQANLFRRKGHDVVIATGSGAMCHEEIPVMIDPLLGSGHPGIRSLGRDPDSFAADLKDYTLRITKLLETMAAGCDLIIAHNVLTMAYNLPLAQALHVLAASAGHTMICWAHDSPYFYKDHMVLLDEPPWTLLRTANPAIDYVTITETRLAQFSQLFGPDISIRAIPNGIDPVFSFGLDPLVCNALAKNGFFESDLIIAQPSRLNPRKNIEFSIKVLHALIRRGIRARLLISGALDPHEPESRAYHRKLKNLANELGVEESILIMAELEGASERSTWSLHDLYLVSDLMLFPSLQEGFGLPLLEAGMYRLPIICSDIEPLREVGGENVHTFSPWKTFSGTTFTQAGSFPSSVMLSERSGGA